ncbi:hypothetical protein CAURIC_05775 [Corynebacterium auriscanis]|nr:hypothetical protein CAURIC_05775 [Corynebacterium auriscanis]
MIGSMFISLCGPDMGSRYSSLKSLEKGQS